MKKIGVIGGGLGGLAAAVTLAARGHAVAVVRAQPVGSAARRRCSKAMVSALIWGRRS